MNSHRPRVHPHFQVFRLENSRCWAKYQQTRDRIKRELAGGDGPYESIWPALRKQGLLPEQLVTLAGLQESINEAMLFHGEWLRGGCAGEGAGNGGCEVEGDGEGGCEGERFVCLVLHCKH